MSNIRGLQAHSEDLLCLFVDHGGQKKYRGFLFSVKQNIQFEMSAGV